ncbi:MAG TPA: acyl carrier protein [Cyclobacteriaceae bacterium]|nr:acyl carrier protein [Cyclobacteriaceae bacterium]
MTHQELINFIKKEIATETGTAVESIDANASFHSLGLDSLSAVLILYNIEKEFGVELNPLNFWDYPTPSKFADFILKGHG